MRKIYATLIGLILFGMNFIAQAQTNTFPSNGSGGIGTLMPNISCIIENSSVCNARTLTVVSTPPADPTLPTEPGMLELWKKSDIIIPGDEVANMRGFEGSTNPTHVGQLGFTSIGNPLLGSDWKLYLKPLTGIPTLVVKNNGFLGINTTNPQYHIDSKVPNNGGIRISSDDAPVFRLDSLNTFSGTRNWEVGTNRVFSGDLLFRVSSVQGGEPNKNVLSMQESGNIGIGVDNPGARVHVNPGQIAMTASLTSCDLPPVPIGGGTGTVILCTKISSINGNIELWAKFPSGASQLILAGQ